jgi:hypothetical protein
MLCYINNVRKLPHPITKVLSNLYTYFIAGRKCCDQTPWGEESLCVLLCSECYAIGEVLLLDQKREKLLSKQKYITNLNDLGKTA